MSDENEEAWLVAITVDDALKLKTTQPALANTRLKGIQSALLAIYR